MTGWSDEKIKNSQSSEKKSIVILLFLEISIAIAADLKSAARVGGNRLPTDCRLTQCHWVCAQDTKEHGIFSMLDVLYGK
jgi:hypothetical protein